MASNPMQRKARNSFLMGVIITLLICAIIGGILIYLFIIQKNKDERGQEVIAYVLREDVKSGQIITPDLLTETVVYENMIPANYINRELLTTMELQDSEGNVLQTSGGKLYINIKNNTEYKSISDKKDDKEKVLIQQEDNRYYKTRNDENESKEYIEFMQVPVIAKVNLNKNTILNSSLISKSNQVITDDVRYVEYNMLTLSTSVEVGDFIDIRLTLPNGLDLIVVSKKEIKTLMGNTVGLELSEDEILMLESSIVEAYIMTASKLYVTQYVEPGNQNAALKTYVPTQEVQNLIKADEGNNIQETAKRALIQRLDGGTRTNIDNGRFPYELEEKENIETKMKEEIENAKAAREEYLQGLAGN